jgi:hypothetical protein
MDSRRQREAAARATVVVRAAAACELATHAVEMRKVAASEARAATSRATAASGAALSEAAALAAAVREARAAHEARVHTATSCAASAAARVARVVALCGSVRCVRQRPYARPSHQRGVRLHTPSDDEEEQDVVKNFEQDVAKKEELNGAAATKEGELP